MDASLNADAALRAYLPPKSWYGDAQHRFLFRTDGGEEEVLLARLAVVQPNAGNRRSKHCVVLRPEHAETARIFVVENFRYRYGGKETNPLMKPSETSRFQWTVFEEGCTYSQISRLALFEDLEGDVVVRIGVVVNWGELRCICGLASGYRCGGRFSERRCA